MDIALKVIGFLLACTVAVLLAVVGISVDNPVPSLLAYSAGFAGGFWLYEQGRKLDKGR